MSSNSSRDVGALIMMRAKALLAIAGLLMLVALNGCSSLKLGPDQQVTPISLELRQQYESALATMTKGDYQGALPNLLAVAAAMPERAGPHFNLGIAYYRSGQTDDAMAALRVAVGLNPEMAAAYNLIGILERQAGDFEASREAYEESISVDPEYANAELNLAILYDIYLRQPEQALLHYARFMDLSEGDDDTVAQWITDLKLRIKKQANEAADGETS